MIVYPTAIGSEPGHPDFDTQPLWQQVIVGNGISNGTFMIAPNRYGGEGRSPSTARRSSPIRTAAYWFRHRATRPLYSAADLDLDQRRDWLTLFRSWPRVASRTPTTV
jgi:N-carbamoylputrescine amidase